MKQVGIWRIEGDQPIRVKASELDLEKQLEDWIEQDPRLIEEGLQIVGRQVNTRGGRLDLLAIDMQGRWTVIELKPSALYRETFAQALDYASCIAEMNPEELERKVDEYLRKAHPDGSKNARSVLADAGSLESLDTVPRAVQIVLVGTGQAHSLERVSDFLAKTYEAPVRTVTFQVFEPELGSKILLRELQSGDDAPSIGAVGPTVDEKLAEVRQRADAAGTRQLLEDFLKVGKELDLHQRPWGRSVMFAPRENKSICLFTLWVDSYKDETVKLWVVPTKIAEFCPVSEEEAARVLGDDSGRRVSHSEARQTLVEIRRVILGAGQA